MKNHEKPRKTMEIQPGTMKNHEIPTWNHEKPLKTNLEPWKPMKNHENMGPQLTSFGANEKVLTGWSNWPSWHRMRKWWFFVTYAGSQLTFMTQNEKVMIFCDPRGVKTDLHDTEWESDHFSWPTRGHNWPSWHRMREWWFFVTNAGSQLTFITQNEKVMIFRDLLTRGHNWPS